jgi:Reverse transcriptase (RNA-dependent DNA polymerase)
MIFLDLKKAYDTLHRNRTMLILEKYGVGKNIQNFIKAIWDGDTMIPKQAGFYGKPFRAKWGVRQGDIISSTIFNIIVDAVIREWSSKSDNNQLVEGLFYADEGLLISEDHQKYNKH